MAIHVSLATPADDAGIRGLLRREAIPGRISISYEREPHFGTGCDATGENATALVARDLDSDTVVGVACRSERQVYVNSKPVRLGYLGQLRIDSRYRGRWLLSKGYTLLKDLHDRDPMAAYLAAVTCGNREAEEILVHKRRRRYPAFHAVADYSTLALHTRREKHAAGVTPCSAADLPEIVRFLEENGPRRQFFPCWSEARLMALNRVFGLEWEDIVVKRRNGLVQGIVGLWDQSAYKQNVVRAYSGWMKLAAPLYNAGSGLMRRAPLPRTGETIRNGYAAFLCIEKDDTAIFRELLSAVLDRAASRGLDYLLLGLDERDPLLAAARERSHIAYRSRLFLAEWPDQGHLHAELDSRPSYVEIATL